MLLLFVGDAVFVFDIYALAEIVLLPVDVFVDEIDDVPVFVKRLESVGLGEELDDLLKVADFVDVFDFSELELGYNDCVGIDVGYDVIV